ncbi:DUF6470 family protein [Bacillus sp. CECT 9360]|uniref:DUF6470 family protein n=1 Tax=Bacillus sp. CECT 9360 TaxID=2845821 RepID=UPI001E5D6CCC|nr:DUF6470 family protein [Bacillus sp. CECT 9360]CAH0344852.1 putative protein YviE [Bacillus sp. CECT 9360]
MQFPQIRLQSQPALIEIQTKPSNQSIEQPGPLIDIQQPPAELTIERVPSKLTIDQTKAREDVDLKSIAKRKEEFAEQGYQDFLAGIARRRQDGDELMRIEYKGNPIAAQAKRNSEKPPSEFNIGWIPGGNSVKLSYEPGRVNIQVKVNKPIINSEVRKPVHSYTPGEVAVRLKQYQSLKIDFENLKFVGFNYEQNI